MPAVPKIWDILKKGVEEVVGGGSPVKAGRLSAVIGGEENSAENASAVGGDDGGSISAAGRTPSSENIKGGWP